MKQNYKQNKCCCGLFSKPTYHITDDPHDMKVKFFCDIHGEQNRYFLIHTEKKDYCKPCHEENQCEHKGKLVDTGHSIVCSSCLKDIFSSSASEKERNADVGKTILKGERNRIIHTIREEERCRIVQIVEGLKRECACRVLVTSCAEKHTWNKALEEVIAKLNNTCQKN